MCLQESTGNGNHSGMGAIMQGEGEGEDSRNVVLALVWPCIAVSSIPGIS